MLIGNGKRSPDMRIFLAGISDVGKTTIGAKLAAVLDYRFFDLDAEIQRFYQTPIERLQNRYSTVHQFRVAAARVLKHVLARGDSHNCVIALPPSGLMGGYWKIVKTTQAATIILLRDTPENILRRITFYDIDSRPLARTLTDREKSFYLREITGDIAYFRRSFQRAHIAVDIAGCNADEASRMVEDAFDATEPRNG